MGLAVAKKRYVSRPVAVRGRPAKPPCSFGPTYEIIKRKEEFGLNDFNMPISMLSSMYSLKKISEEEYEAAKFYEELAYKAIGTTDCASRKTSSLLSTLSNESKGKKEFSKNHQKIWKKWIRIRAILMESSKEIDKIIYQVLVKNKPANHMQINLFKNGLAIIYDYCSKSKKYKKEI
ncbi:hypothetical protein FZC35_00525 [Candidatus Cytomitobacter indipagum]|uniref:Uncharacterized protein n=1 Tax=Candidatus Cytomitobacter indipagum TaxID=2601575 RepID=A0A5C0UDV1_9PROT|nr:hypothetical protein [Candidatus Cytomitobacter indipagum]QEK37870.1 hypothetical protein FZC35_00525 [Candidatus Cytomitobacter indipagum]